MNVGKALHLGFGRMTRVYLGALLCCTLAHGLEGAEEPKGEHWSFQAARRLGLPQVKQEGWAQNPVDLFILSKLEGEAMTPSAEADRRTLIRRVSFDLTGLPPAPEEVERFVSDSDPKAYEKLVGRLLASPRYGERWARHWLDVVHFGETHGYDKDKLRPNAWPYRDYVIRALNEDKPYSRFVQEQIAGDVLFPDEPEGIVATGFIAAGPWDFVGHVELPITKTDGLIARYNDRDDMVMTTMSTFQSLTVHCARCHDHKFDPISQREYYSLQAVFAGVDRAERPYDEKKETLEKRRSLLAERERLQGRQKELEASVAKLTSPELVKLDGRYKEITNQLAAAPLIHGKRGKTLGYHSKIEKSRDVSKWVQVDLGSSVSVEQVLLVPAFEVFGTHHGPGFGFPARFRVDVSDDPKFERFQTVADRASADFPHPGNLPFLAQAAGKKARYVRVTATRLWKRTDDWIFALGEMIVLSEGTNVAAGKPVQALDSIEASPAWGKANLVNNESVLSLSATNGNPTQIVSWLLQSQGLRQEREQLAQKRVQLVNGLMAPAVRAELDSTRARLAAISNELARLPAPRWVYAAANDFKPEGSFLPAKGVRPVHYLARGDVKRPREEMSPAALEAVPGPKFELKNAAQEGERRAALARWITDPSNMLTRRSIVNRVWQYHFGKGIVDSPNDFGIMGALPTHPELLDWLAFWFLDNGESIKALHRLILTSATYRQSSADHPEFARKDGDNRWLWRMNRARLDAESIHDAMLFVSGKLDTKMGGPSVRQFYFKDDHSPVYDYTRFDVNSPEANRRSIYRHIVRSVPDPFMDSLDCADPSLLVAKRNTTLTALQALATFNNPFVLKQAEHFAQRLEKLSPEPEKQIDWACRMALGRPSTEKERKLLVPYARKHGLANACRLLFNSNEFIFVE